MVAGHNTLCRIWRINTSDDDEVGGAVLTGTVVYSHIPVMFQSEPAQQVFLQQGLQTERTFSAVIVPGYLDIRERDELEVMSPVDHVYYSDRFRIVGVNYSSHNRRDPRNYLRVDMIRSVFSHAELYQ
jgi:hypothetical protein